MLSGLADIALRRRRLMLAATLVVALVAAAFGAGLATKLDPIGAEDPASQSVKARERIERAAGLEPDYGIVALVSARNVDSAAAQRSARRVMRVLSSDPAVGRVRSFLDSGRAGRALTSRDRSTGYVAAQFRPDSNKHRQDAAERIAGALDGVPHVTLGGTDLVFSQLNARIQQDLRRAELFAFPILFLLALWFFRGIVAALLPVALGGLAILLTTAMLRVTTAITPLSAVTMSLVTALGLGLALDYSLLIVSRFREEMAAAEDQTSEALRRTLRTAGRTVCFSGLTVTAALGSLIVLPQEYFRSMGVGGAFVALLACGGALLVLPPLLAALGPRVNALAPARLQRSAAKEARPATSGAWYRLARAVMARPVSVAMLATGVMVALALPCLGMRFTGTDARTLPTSSSARQVADVLSSDYAVDPARVVTIVSVGARRAQLHAYRAKLARHPGVAVVLPIQQMTHETALVELTPRAPALSERADALVKQVRATAPRYVHGVTGPTAGEIDFKRSVADHVPMAAGLMVLATTIALFLLTGSVILPIKALLMNVLTVGAAFGILVLVFQDGHLEGLLGFDSFSALDVAQPVLLLAVVLGLSTDYGVFLLDRIREGHEAGLDNEDAVALGLERTGRIVTTAALLFCVAIGALVSSSVIGVKEVSLGTATAILLDATIVRALLVPALMRLLGDWNWWSPAVLRRLYRPPAPVEEATPA